MSEHSHDHVHDDAVFEGTVAWEGVTVPAAPSSNSTVAWFHCFSGIAGDMALGALIDAGADVNEIRSMLQQLPVLWLLQQILEFPVF